MNHYTDIKTSKHNQEWFEAMLTSWLYRYVNSEDKKKPVQELAKELADLFNPKNK